MVRDSGPRPSRPAHIAVAVVFTVIAAATYVIMVGFVHDQWGTVLTFVGIGVLGNVLLRPLFARPDLSTGRYTVTDRRIVVQDRVVGVRLCRIEWLTDLVTPQLIDVDTAHPSVAFGDPKEQKPSGHYANGVVVSQLVLWSVAEPHRVLDIIHRAQADARTGES